MPLKKVKISELVKYLHDTYPDSEQPGYLGIFTVLRMKVLEAKRAGVDKTEIAMSVESSENSVNNNVMSGIKNGEKKRNNPKNGLISFDAFLKSNSLAQMIGQIDEILSASKHEIPTTKPGSSRIFPQFSNSQLQKSIQNKQTKNIMQVKELKPKINDSSITPNPSVSVSKFPKWLTFSYWFNGKKHELKSHDKIESNEVNPNHGSKKHQSN